MHFILYYSGNGKHRAVGCSNLLVKAFGEDVGRHARAAAGFVSLPLSASVEIEMIVEVQ